MRYTLQRPRLLPVILICAIGALVGVGFRTFLDDASERDLANYARSAVHGAGIALAGWTVQTFFASNAQSPLGAALRRLPMLGELVVRSMVSPKKASCRLVRSLACPPDLRIGEGKSVALRGRQEPIEVHVIHEAATTAVAAA